MRTARLVFTLALALAAPAAAQFWGFGGGDPWKQNTVTFSATPAFDLAAGTLQKITLTADVTASTATSLKAGQWTAFLVCQDAAGAHAFVWPANVKGGMTIGSVASKCSAQSFVSDGTNLYAVSPGVVNQ